MAASVPVAFLSAQRPISIASFEFLHSYRSPMSSVRENMTYAAVTPGDSCMGLVKHTDVQMQGDVTDAMWNMESDCLALLNLLHRHAEVQPNNLYYGLAVFKELSLSFIPGLAAIWFALFLDSLLCRKRRPWHLPFLHLSREFEREGILSERDFFFKYQGCLVLFLSSKNNRPLPSAV